MKAFAVLLLAALGLSPFATAHAASQCPIPSEKETLLDCPWAGIVRDLESSPTTDASEIGRRLKELAPSFIKHLDREAKLAGEMKNLWGRAINFDEGAKGIIVQDAVLDAVLTHAKVPARGVGVESSHPERISHAGFEHTYGYVLSNLKTPYGYKRLRWVRPDIEKGFGIHPGTITPLPKKGGLFANVTYFAGRIAFRDSNEQDAAALKILRRARGVSSHLHRFNFGALHGRRLLEVISLEGGRTVEIRTDFVPFTVTSGEATGGNTELLIYSFRDSALKLPYLVTAFPVAKGFSDGATDPKNLGEGKPIITRYNAWVPGVTESKTPLTGNRSVSTF